MQKDSESIQKDGETTQKTTQKTTRKEIAKLLENRGIELNDNQFGVLFELARHPHYSRKDLVDTLDGITSDGIKYIIGRL